MARFTPRTTTVLSVLEKRSEKTVTVRFRVCFSVKIKRDPLECGDSNCSLWCPLGTLLLSRVTLCLTWSFFPRLCHASPPCSALPNCDRAAAALLLVPYCGGRGEFAQYAAAATSVASNPFPGSQAKDVHGPPQGGLPHGVPPPALPGTL